MLKGGLVLIWELDMNLVPTLMYTLIGCNSYCEITVAHVTQPMTVNWL